jgi:hypothetical protein
MKTYQISSIFIILIILNGNTNLFSQKFEGILNYKILYLPKNKNINVKRLEARNGTQITVFVKKGFYKSVRFNGKDTMETAICRNTDGLKYFHSENQAYYTVRNIEPENQSEIKKTDSVAEINGNRCDVYTYKTGNTSALFFTAQNSEPADKNFRYHTIALFNGPLLKIIVKNPDYVTIINLDKKDEKTLDVNVFKLKNFYLATSSEEITNKVLSSEMQDKLMTDLYRKIKYPNALKQHQYIGKVEIDLTIDENGNLQNTQIEPVYFRKYLTLKNISDKKKIEKLRKSIEKEYNAVSSECLANIRFEKPKTKYGNTTTVISLPMTFTTDNDYSESTYYNENNDENSEHFEFSYDDDDFN